MEVYKQKSSVSHLFLSLSLLIKKPSSYEPMVINAMWNFENIRVWADYENAFQSDPKMEKCFPSSPAF
jgi:hypothetical protein